VGGDQGDMVALLTAPGSRLGGLAPGEVAIYAADGSRVHVKAGGIIEILAATKVIIRAPAVEIEAPDGVTITGNLHVVGDITATGTITP
jgi:phage gp45-like